MSGYVSFHVPRWWFWIRFLDGNSSCPRRSGPKLIQNLLTKKTPNCPKWTSCPSFTRSGSLLIPQNKTVWNIFEFSFLEFFWIQHLLNSEKEKLWNGKYAKIFRTILRKPIKIQNQMMILVNYFRSMWTRLSIFSHTWDRDSHRNGHYKCSNH